MSQDKTFYRILGHELMAELAAAVGSEVCPAPFPGAYEQVQLSNGMHVSFTSWRDGEGPFYIILFEGAKYLFQLDLSMIVHQLGSFTWHLKVPSHETNRTLLNAFLGQAGTLPGDYSGAVAEVKKRVESGTNTPRTGYHFVDSADWLLLCSRYLELMRLAINAHTSTPLNFCADSPAGSRTEAADDDGRRVTVTRAARRYQAQFKLKLLELYDYACAITGETVPEVLEAAHISEHSASGVNDSRNGLLLRSDLHRLFDKGLIAIEPTSAKVVVSAILAHSTYQQYNGRILRARKDNSQPDPAYLEQRWVRAQLETLPA